MSRFFFFLGLELKCIGAHSPPIQFAAKVSRRTFPAYTVSAQSVEARPLSLYSFPISHPFFQVFASTARLHYI